MKTNHIKLTLICLIAVAFNTANAQSDSDQRDVLAFGIKAGINISNLYDTEGEDFTDKSKIGFAGGIFVSIPIGTYVGFQPEVIYSQKGYKGSGSFLLMEYEYTRKVDYLDIPLLLQIKPIPVLSLLVGPHFSFLLHKGLSFNSGDINVEQETEIENDNIRKNIFGVTGGLDFDLHPVVISGRVGWDLQHNDGEGTSTDPRFKNVWIQTTLGLKF